MIYPYLSYGLPTWGCATNTNLKCLCIKQNKCLRSIFFANARENANPYYKLLGILKLEAIYKFRICCLTYKINIKSDSIPGIFLDILTPASEKHNYNTSFASNNNFFRPRVSTNTGKSSFIFSASKIWETVPTYLKYMPYTNFKREWKHQLLLNQTWLFYFAADLLLRKMKTSKKLQLFFNKT